ncbi:hypothetical protein ACE14D_09945 [Streptomyces sp. Act-28]
MTTTGTDGTGTRYEDDGPEAAALLDRAHAAVTPLLRADLATLPAPLRRVATYHLGWEHADGTPAAGRSGTTLAPSAASRCAATGSSVTTTTSRTAAQDSAAATVSCANASASRRRSGGSTAPASLLFARARGFSGTTSDQGAAARSHPPASAVRSSSVSIQAIVARAATTRITGPEGGAYGVLDRPGAWGDT